MDIWVVIQREKANNVYFSNKKCYPFELNIEKEKYLYNSCSNGLVDMYPFDAIGESVHPNIACFSQEKGIGKTFEYSLAYNNPNCKMIITNSITNSAELNELFDAHIEKKGCAEMILLHSQDGKENNRVIASISNYDKVDNATHLVAARYLNSISKGENAYELAQALEDNLEADIASIFKVPNYIKEAITWICK
jgi:putative ATP-dependent endonuclease of OLD family